MHPIFWALLALFLFGALMRMDWVYYLAYVVGGAWIFSTWSVRRSLSRLTITRELLDKAFAGQTIEVRLKVTNRSRVPLAWLRVEERVPLDLKDLTDYQMAFSIGGRDTVERLYKLNCKRRGYYPLGPLSLKTGDLFGFSEARWEEVGPRHLTVYPQVFPLHELGLPSRIPIGGLPSPLRLYEDPARLTGLRAYAVGDSQRRIHWKASAHADALLVKKFQPAIGLDVVIALDLARAAYGTRYVIGASEWAISVAASIAAAVVAQRQPLGLICHGTDAASNAPPPDLPARSGQAQLMAVLSTLARAQLRDDAPAFDQWLSPRLASLGWGTTLVVVAPRVTDDLLWMLHQSQIRGASVMILQVVDAPGSLDTVARARRLGMSMSLVQWERDFRKVG